MKKWAILLSIMFIGYTIIAQADWTLTSYIDDAGYIECWPDSPTEFVFSSGGYLLFTEDSFVTADTLLSSYNCFSVHPSDHNVILADDGSSNLSRTTDRGITWTPSFTGYYSWVDFCGCDGNIVWLVGDVGIVMRSTDMGAVSYTHLTLPTN